MHAYKYDQSTGEFLGVCPLVSNPRRPDAPCLSAFSTMKPVPEDVPLGHALRYVDEEVGWEIVEDHRGAVWYRPENGEAVRITDLGPVPAGLVAELPPEPLAALYTAKRAEIRDKADALLQEVGSEYGAMERQTWEQQHAEAKALQADPQADAPLVRAIALARGMDVLELAGRILANADAWKLISGHVVGQRLAYQDALDAASNLAGTDEDAARAAIAAVVPEYSLPVVA